MKCEMVYPPAIEQMRKTWLEVLEQERQLLVGADQSSLTATSALMPDNRSLEERRVRYEAVAARVRSELGALAAYATPRVTLERDVGVLPDLGVKSD